MRDAASRPGKIRILFSLLLFIALVVIALLVLSHSSMDAEAAEITVDHAGGGDHTTLLPAVKDAQSGDTVRVANGSYIADGVAAEIRSGVTIIGDGEGATHFLFQSPISSFVLWRSDIRIDGVRFATVFTGHTNIMKFSGSNISITNCTFSKVDIQFEVGLHTGITFTDNSMLGAKFSFIAPWDLYTFPEILRWGIIAHNILTLSTWDLSGNSFNGLPYTFLSNVSNTDVDSIGGGLILYNCTNITITGDSTSVSNGITILNSQLVTIAGSHIRSDTNVLSLWLTENVTVSNCTLGSPGDILPRPIYPLAPSTSTTRITLYSRFLRLVNSTTHLNVTIEGDSDPTVTGTTFNGQTGLTLWAITRATITGNSFEARGLGFFLEGTPGSETHYRHEIRNNSVAGVPISYLLDLKDETISSSRSQIFLVNCTNITVDGVTTNNVSQGIFLSQTTLSFIRNCDLTDIQQAVVLISSDLNYIEWSTFERCPEAVTLLDATSNTFVNCIIRDGTVKMEGPQNFIFHSTISYSSEGWSYIGISGSGTTRVINCTISGFGIGIRVIEGSLTVRDSNILENRDGIRIEEECTLSLEDTEITNNDHSGITSRNPNDMRIFDSTISSNGENGVELGGGGSVLSGSTIENNGENGVVVDGDSITISDCFIIGNGGSGILTSFSQHLSIDGCKIRHNREGFHALGSQGFHVGNSSFLGNLDDGILVADGSNGIIKSSTVTGSPYGIRLDVTKVDIFDCTILENQIGIFAFRPPGIVTISRCSIHGNSQYGISTPFFNAHSVLASNNYWGDKTGPHHIRTNPDGKGDRVEDEIIFSPWYESDRFLTLRYTPEPKDKGTSYDDLDILIFTLIFLIAPLVIGHKKFKEREELESHKDGGGHPGDKGSKKKRKKKIVKKRLKTKKPRVKISRHDKKDVIIKPESKEKLEKWKEPEIISANAHGEEKSVPSPDDLTFAPISSRVDAAFIDGIIISFFIMIFFLFIVVYTESSDVFCGLMLLVYLLVPVEYYLLTDGLTGQTIGKETANIELISLTGAPISRSQAFRSAIAKGVLFPIIYVIDVVLGIFIQNTETQQRVSQRMAGLIVVKSKKKNKKKSIYWGLREERSLSKLMDEKMKENEPGDSPAPASHSLEFDELMDEYSLRLKEMHRIWTGLDEQDLNDETRDSKSGSAEGNLDEKGSIHDREHDQEADEEPPPPPHHEMLDPLINPAEDGHVKEALISAQELLMKVDETLKLLRKAESRINSIKSPTGEFREPSAEGEHDEHAPSDSPDHQLEHERIVLMEGILDEIPSVESSLFSHGESLLDGAFELTTESDIKAFEALQESLRKEMDSAMDLVESSTDLVHSQT